MFDNIKPGQTIRCTITKNIKPGDHLDTVRRLMRFDPDIKRKLKAAQTRRSQNNPIQIWGGRPKVRAPKATRYANPVKDATWTMQYFPHVAPDFRSVQQYLSVEPA